MVIFLAGYRGEMRLYTHAKARVGLHAEDNSWSWAQNINSEIMLLTGYVLCT